MGAGGSRGSYVIPIVNGCGCGGAGGAGLMGASSLGGGFGGGVSLGNCCESLKCGTPVVRLGRVRCSNLRLC